MKKIYLALLGIFLALAVFVTQVEAVNGFKNKLLGYEKEFRLPEQAKQVRPNVYYLGQAKDKGRVVEGYAIIHKKKEPAKPGTDCGNGECEPSENKNNCSQDCGGGDDTETDSQCYDFLGKGVKWRTVEDYLVDPTNNENLTESEISGILATSISKWEDAAENYNILGNEVSGTVDGADSDRPDDKNEVLFGNISDEGAIAVTIVWGVFRGKPSTREIIEWDQVYNDDYDWSTGAESGKMDFENIATHELGHSVGMADLYEDSCIQETMYGYADYGETNKRDLEQGDITGVRELYR